MPLLASLLRCASNLIPHARRQAPEPGGQARLRAGGHLLVTARSVGSIPHACVRGEGPAARLSADVRRRTGVLASGGPSNMEPRRTRPRLRRRPLIGRRRSASAPTAASDWSAALGLFPKTPPASLSNGAFRARARMRTAGRVANKRRLACG